jgi:nitroreductase
MCSIQRRSGALATGGTGADTTTTVRSVTELADVMRTSFACREFTDDPVPDQDVTAILDLARFAPSGGNRQGWKVVVVREQATKSRLVDLCLPGLRLYMAQRRVGENPWNTIEPTSVDPATVDGSDRTVEWFKVLEQAPVLLIVGVDLRLVASTDKELDRIGVVSGASVYPFVQNILLAARDRGYAGSLTTFLAAAEQEVQQLLGFPPEVAVVAMVPLGRPRTVLTKLTRKPVPEFATLERFDGPTLGA